MSAPASAAWPVLQPPVRDEQTAAMLFLVARHAERLGYTTYTDRLAHAITVAPADVAAWITAGTRHAVALALNDLRDNAPSHPDLLYDAGLISSPGADDRYITTTATRLAATCDALASTGLLRYQQPSPAQTPPPGRRPAGENDHDCLASARLRFDGIYGPPGVGQAWRCGACNRHWSRVGDVFHPEEEDAHILTLDDCR
ncbi:hypothetical protein HDA40_002157 [Hamadaea flava]|uniref:DUF222 domain-containing protein n=1 Tax=Hamadaea flava TaxID=1742688 RepID=A0ABV8LL34_9ACTN|nr:hypothetical protein [Hamadaea flava]MCP2323650.1 hypothetical protein [Hamadaea flava]